MHLLSRCNRIHLPFLFLTLFSPRPLLSLCTHRTGHRFAAHPHDIKSKRGYAALTASGCEDNRGKGMEGAD